MPTSAQNLEQLNPEQRKQLEEKLKNLTPEQLKELQKQQCIFCQIVAGKVPAKKLYEDESVMVVLDINPAARGHLLILPKEHYQILPQMSEIEVGNLYAVAQKLSQLLLKSLHADGTTIFLANGQAAGQRAQHVMLHLIPRKEGDGLLPVQDKVLDKVLWATNKEAIESYFKSKKSPSESLHTSPQQTITSHQSNIPAGRIAGEKSEVKERKDSAKKSQKKADQKKEKSDSPEPEKSKEQAEEDPSEEDRSKEDSDSRLPEGRSKEREEVSLDDIANLFK